MTRFRLRACGVVSALAFGCGGGQQSAKDAALVTAPAPTSALVAEDPPDLSPIAAPADLVLVGRFKNPHSAVDTVGKWVGAVVSIPDLVPEDARSLAKLVDWQAPVEVAVALDARGEGKMPQPLAIVSIGLSSLAEAVSSVRASGATVRRVQPGVFRTGLADPSSCALAAAAGKAPARLVCGDRWKDVEELLGYATRGLPNQSLGEADLVVDLVAEPLQRRYSRDLAGARLLLGVALRRIELDSARFDRALADVAYAAADELVALANDLDRLRVEATLDQKREELSLDFRLKFKGQASWSVQTLQAMPSGAAPPEFFRLPEGMTSASFGYGVPQGRIDPLIGALSDLAEGYLEAQKLPRPSRERWRKLVERLLKLGGTSVFGEGEFAKLGSSDPLAKNALSELGWALSYLPNRPAEVTGFMNELVLALEDASFRKLLKEKFDLEDTVIPRFKKRAITVPNFKGQGLLVEVSLPSEILPALEFLFEAHDEKTHGKLVLIAVPDGTGTWIGYGADQKRLLTKFAELRGDTSKRHAALRHLTQVKAVSGGYTTLFGLLSSFREELKDVDKVAASLPGHGLSPMVGLGTVEREAGGTTLGVRMSVPRAAIADVAALAPLLSAEGLSSGGVMKGPIGIVPPPAKSP